MAGYGSPDQAILPYTEHYVGAGTSILFIHGSFCDNTDWDLVVPFLDDHHLVTPDLPGHGNAAHLPFSNPLSAQMLAHLIRVKGQNGKAHVVGLSLGLHVAVELATVYPEVVDDMFISGLKMMPRSLASETGARALYANKFVEDCAPRPLVRWFLDGADVGRSPPCNMTLDYCRAVLAVITSADRNGEWPNPWQARTCIICAGKSGILPTADHANDTIRLRDIGREANNMETVAYTHPLMRHPWNRQDPKLFATALKCWLEREQLPEGFVLL